MAVDLSYFVNVLQNKNLNFQDRNKKKKSQIKMESTCNIINTNKQEMKIHRRQSELTLKISNQNVTFTGHKTRIPERIALWRTTPLSFCNRAARCNVGPLPTD